MIAYLKSTPYRLYNQVIAYSKSTPYRLYNLSLSLSLSLLHLLNWTVSSLVFSWWIRIQNRHLLQRRCSTNQIDSAFVPWVTTFSFAALSPSKVVFVINNIQYYISKQVNLCNVLQFIQ